MRIFFAAIAALAICAAVVAGEKLSKEVSKNIAELTVDLKRMTAEKPLTFYELCWLQSSRLELDEDEENDIDPLQSLYALRHGLRKGIRRLDPYWRPKEAAEKEYQYIHREFDVSDIVTAAPDRPAPRIGFGQGPALRGATTRRAPEPVCGGGIMFGDDESIGSGFDWESICELIERVIPEEDEVGYREIRYVNGKLICHITPEDAKKLGELLDKLREGAGYSVKMEVRFIIASVNYLRALGGTNSGMVYLSPEAEKKLLDDIKAKRNVEMVALSEVIASDGQTVHIREGRQVSMLMDYDVSTVGIPTMQPVVQLVNEGLICQFIPAVIRNGKAVSIDVLASLSSIRKDTRKSSFMGGDLTLPVMDISLLRSAVRVSDGTAVLVGGVVSGTNEEGKDAREFVIYLKSTVEKKR